MGKSQKLESKSAKSPWLPGFSISDFTLPPSKKTEIAEVTKTVSRAVIDLSDSVTIMNDTLSTADVEAEECQTAFMQVVEAWGQTAEEEDSEGRKVHWPQIKALAYSPAPNADTRIEDNIAAIKLLKELNSNTRAVTDEDRVSLLKYCGWGGLARVFSPDGSAPHKWAGYRSELEALTSESEFEQMRSSVVSAYYTDPRVVSSIWEIARHLGFTGGRVLEPSAGVGHFLAGMPADMAEKSEITAVELDTISAGLLEANFAPLGVQVHASALEKAKLPVAFYDLVIGNVPFGDHKSLDTSTADYADWSIHNYFVGKSIDLVRPGGLIILITSAHTMDSKNSGHREWLAAHADLISAFRLPTMAFKGQANTEAVTDILVLRLREVPDYHAGGWVESVQALPAMFKSGHGVVHRNGSYVEVAKINAHYVANPSHVIGFLEWQSTQHGFAVKPVFEGDADQLEAALLERASKLPSGIYKHAPRDASVAPRSGMSRVALDTYLTPGAFVYKNGQILVSEGEELLDIDALYSGTARKRVIGMIGIKERALEVIEFQAKSQDDVELQKLQGMLNAAYDHFVQEFGFLSISANSRLMRTDPDWSVMLALEVWDDEEGVATKADIFSKRTVGNRPIPEKVDSVKDAMLLSLSLYGRIVLKDISLRTGLPVAQVVKEFGANALAYRDPQLARWVPADEYLSGTITEKIAAAKAAGPAYAQNIAPLEQVLPKDLGPIDVEARLGAPWIPNDVIATFATELVEAEEGKIDILYESQTASWSVKSSYGLDWVGNRTLQVHKWGTDKRCALVLLEGALNQTPPTVTRTIDGKPVVDRVATLNARDKWQAIKDQFRAWVYQDTKRTERLLRIYNDLFNKTVARKFDGSHLTLPGMSQVVTPWPHQFDAIWRVVCSGNTLLAHAVGAGKTLVMAAASMELRRLGKSSKPVHVTMNNCLEQYAAEFVRLYPQAKLLIMRKEDLHGDMRRTFLARVCTGNWDAVIMTQSTFERVMLSPEWAYSHLDQISTKVKP